MKKGTFTNIDLSSSLQGNLNTVSQIAFTPLSDHLLFGSINGDFGVSLLENKKSMILHNIGENISHVKVPRDGVISALMGQSNLAVYDLVKQIPFYSISNNNANCLDFGNRAGRLILGDKKGSLQFLDLRQKSLSSEIKISNCPIEELSIHPFQDFLMIGDSKGCLKVIYY